MSKTSSDDKILRIGLIQNGKIVEERLLRSRDDLTIGRNFDQNTLVVPVSDLPESYPVFEVRNGGYVLNFTPQMDGRLSTSEGVRSLGELKRSGEADEGKHGSYVEVSPETRGRVQIGDVTLLFQFVTPPPARPEPALPASMRGGWLKGLDATLVGVVGLSALLQIGFIVYLETQDWPEPKEQSSKTLNRFVKVKQPDRPESKKKPDLNKEKSQENKKQAKEKKSKPSENKPQPKEKPDKKKKEQVDPEKQAAKEAERQRKVAKKVKQKTILGQIGSVSKKGKGTVADVLENGAAQKSMDKAFENSEGIAANSGGEKSGLSTSGSSDAEGSGEAAGIGELGKTEGAAEAEKKDVETGQKQEEKVQANVDLKAPPKTAGTGKLNSDSISRTIKRYSGRIQRCYERQLKVDSKASGKVVVNFTIGKAGRVTQTKPVNNSVGGSVGSCVAGVIKSLRFPRPKGGNVIVNKSFVFESG